MTCDDRRDSSQLFVGGRANAAEGGSEAETEESVRLVCEMVLREAEEPVVVVVGSPAMVVSTAMVVGVAAMMVVADTGSHNGEGRGGPGVHAAVVESYSAG